MDLDSLIKQFEAKNFVVNGKNIFSESKEFENKIEKLDTISTKWTIEHKLSFYTNVEELIKNEKNIFTNDKLLEHLAYYKNVGIYENNIEKSNQVSFKIIFENSFQDILLHQILPQVCFGQKICILVPDVSTKKVDSLLLFLKNVIDGKVKDDLITCFATEKNFEKLTYDPVPTVVIFHESDFISAIHNLIKLVNEFKFKKWLILTELNIFETFKASFNFEIKNKTKNSVNHISKYEFLFNDFDFDSFLVSKLENKILFLNFTNRAELEDHLNHICEIPFLSVWNKDVIQANYLIKNVRNSCLAWVNCFANYHPEASYKLIKYKEGNIAIFTNRNILKESNLKNFLDTNLQKVKSVLSNLVNLPMDDILKNIYKISKNLNVLDEIVPLIENFKNNIQVFKTYKNYCCLTENIGLGILVIELNSSIPVKEIDLLKLTLLCYLTGNGIIWVNIKNKDLLYLKKIRSLDIDEWAKNGFAFADSNCFLDDECLKLHEQSYGTQIGNYINWKLINGDFTYKNLKDVLFKSTLIWYQNYTNN